MDPKPAPTLDLIQGLTEKEVQVEHLESVIVALSTKINTINDMEKEQVRNRQLIQEGDEGRVHLQAVITESSQRAANLAAQNKKYQDDVVSENNELRNEVDRQTTEIRNRDDTIHERDFAINNRDREITTLQAALANLQEMKALNEGLNRQINDSEQSRRDLQNQFDRAIADHN